MYTKGVFPPSYPILQASWELAHKNKHKQALKLLLKAPEKDRDSKWSIAYSNFQYNLGNIEAAMQHLEYVLQFSQQLSIKENERKNPLTSKNFKVYSALAYNYLALNRTKEALYIFRKRANMPYEAKDLNRGISKQSDILKVAELALEIGKNNLAITYFNRLSPGPKIIPQELTKIPPLKSLNEYHDEVFPKEKLFGLALTHERIGEIKKAFFYYAELIQRFPHHQQGLTKFYKMVQNYDIVEDFSLREQGIELFHKLADQHTSISLLQTLAAKTEQSPDNKRKNLENLQKRFPNQHEISYALARVCLKQRDYESAFSYALACKKNNPNLHQAKINAMTAPSLEVRLPNNLLPYFQLAPNAYCYLVGASAHACIDKRPFSSVNIVVNTGQTNFFPQGLSACPYNENLYTYQYNGICINYYVSPVREINTEHFLFQDALTRDFTYNCLYIDAQGVVHDPLIGLALEHYKKSILATPIPANRSFQEDPARLLHALAALTHGYDATPELWEALHEWQAGYPLNKDHLKAIMRKDLSSFNEQQTEQYLNLLRTTHLASKLFNIPSSLVSITTIKHVIRHDKRKLDFFSLPPRQQTHAPIQVHPDCIYDESYSQLILERIKNSPFI